MAGPNPGTLEDIPPVIKIVGLLGCELLPIFGVVGIDSYPVWPYFCWYDYACSRHQHMVTSHGMLATRDRNIDERVQKNPAKQALKGSGQWLISLVKGFCNQWSSWPSFTIPTIHHYPIASRTIEKPVKIIFNHYVTLSNHDDCNVVINHIVD